MRTYRILTLGLSCSLCFVLNDGALAQKGCVTRSITDPMQLPYHEFRSVKNGDWEDCETWEEYYPETHEWHWPAEHVPNFEKGYIKIQSYVNGTADTVSITTPVAVDQLTIHGQLKVLGPKGYLTVTKDPNNDAYDLEAFDELLIEGGLNGGRFRVLSGAKAHITFEGEFKIVEGPFVNAAVQDSSASIENLGEIFIEGQFVSEAGSVTGNPFRYGINATLYLNNIAGSVIDSACAFWPSTNGPLRVNARGPVLMNAPRTLYVFTAAAHITNAYHLSFGANGTAMIDPGGFFDSSPIYSDFVTLIYQSGGTYNVGKEWASGTAVGRGVPQNIKITNNTTVIMPNSPRRCPGVLDIQGDFPLISRGTLILSTLPGADLAIGIGWSKGSRGTFIPNSRQVVFDGNKQGHFFGSTTFDNLTINNPAGVYLDGGPIEVKQTLTFIVGNIVTQGPSLVLSGDVVGASPSAHVLTLGTDYGRVERTISGGDSFQFPIGPTAMTYNPITIVLDPNDPTETFGVIVSNTATPPSLFVQPIWSIREATEGGNHAALTFQWAGVEEGVGFKRNASSTYYSAGGDYVEVVRNGVVSGNDPYIVTTEGGFSCTEFHPNSLSSAYTLGNSKSSNIGEETHGMPTAFTLNQNYPNPFNPSTTISFALPEAQEVTLAIYSMQGQLVRTLVASALHAGHHSVVWNGHDAHGRQVASGIYVYILKAGEFVAQRKLVLMR